MKQTKYLKEEFHRGKWIPFLIDNKNTGKEEQACAILSSEQADELNLYQNEYRVRYVLPKVDGATDGVIDGATKTIKEIYIEEVGKKPFNGWSEEVIAEKLQEFRDNQ